MPTSIKQDKSLTPLSQRGSVFSPSKSTSRHSSAREDLHFLEQDILKSRSSSTPANLFNTIGDVPAKESKKKLSALKSSPGLKQYHANMVSKSETINRLVSIQKESIAVSSSLGQEKSQSSTTNMSTQKNKTIKLPPVTHPTAISPVEDITNSPKTTKKKQLLQHINSSISKNLNQSKLLSRDQLSFVSSTVMPSIANDSRNSQYLLSSLDSHHPDLKKTLLPRPVSVSNDKRAYSKFDSSAKAGEELVIANESNKNYEDYGRIEKENVLGVSQHHRFDMSETHRQNKTFTVDYLTDISKPIKNSKLEIEKPSKSILGIAQKQAKVLAHKKSSFNAEDVPEIPFTSNLGKVPLEPVPQIPNNAIGEELEENIIPYKGLKKQKISNIPIKKEGENVTNENNTKVDREETSKIEEVSKVFYKGSSFKIIKSYKMADLNQVLDILSNQAADWEDLNDAMEKLASILSEQPHLCISYTPLIVRYSLREVASLRFAVSKTALKVLCNLFENLGSKLDHEIDKVVACLVKKCGERNNAMKEICDIAITAVCKHVTPVRVVFSVLPFSDHKNTNIRRKVVTMIRECTMGHQVFLNSDEVPSSSHCSLDKFYNNYEFDKLLAALWQLSGDGNSETRKDAKLVLHYFYSRTPKEVLEKSLQRNAAAPQMIELSEAMEEFKRRTSFQSMANAPPISPSKGQLKKSKPSSSKTDLKTANLDEVEKKEPKLPEKPVASKGILDQNVLEDVRRKIGSSDWKERTEGLMELLDLTQSYPEYFVIQKNILVLFDTIFGRLKDGNSKVVMVTLSYLSKAIPVLKDGLNSVIVNLLDNLTHIFSATQQITRELSHQVLDAIVEWGDMSILCPYLCRALQYGKNIKVRQVYISRLITMVPKMYGSKPYLLSKHVVPLSLYLIKNETKTELKKSSYTLIKALHGVSGGDLLQPHVLTMFGVSEANIRNILAK